MKKSTKISVLLLAVLLVNFISLGVSYASNANVETNQTQAVESNENISHEGVEFATIGRKSIASAILMGVVGIGAALAMGYAIAKSVEGISRQPEAESKIRAALMIGLVFIETIAIYALVVTILIIFVL